MTVGLNKSEIQSGPAVSASRTTGNHHSLPTEKLAASLEYAGKLPESSILKHLTEPYLCYDTKGKAKPADIEPNGFVLSDNWFALHTILQSGVKATLVYLDPPYATGLGFQSRQLQHAYDDFMSNATYVEFMRRRLILLREILADDGSIYVHIGHQMLAHMKIIMDEVFGEKNFRNLITRRKCSSKNFTKNQYPNLCDYILFYSKTSRYKWNRPTVQPTDAWIDKEYRKSDARGLYKLVPVHAPGVRRGETGLPWREKLPPPGKHWQFAPSKLDELDAAGEIHWSKNGNPRRKIYLDTSKGLPVTDYWDQFRDAHHQSVMVSGYPTEKNLEMLKLIVKASSDPGDLVLDPFCGSGTTLHAADDLKRQWIGIDQSFAAASATLIRLRNGLEPMGDFVTKIETTPDLFNNDSSSIPPKTRIPSIFSLFVDAQIADEFATEIVELARI